MQLLRLLHKTFQIELPFIHKVRLEALMGAVQTLICFNKLSLTALGRNYLNGITQRSNIRKMDRLLANKHLNKERFSIYQHLARKLIARNSKALIQVDWSCMSSTTNMYLLRASLCMPGRSIVVYEESHPKKSENNHRIHKAFLYRLKAVLPEFTSAIIITDAGFRAPWFAFIRELEWDFVGRLRNKNLVRLEAAKIWKLSSLFFEMASSIPRYLGAGLLTEATKVPIQLVAYKSKQKDRHRFNKNKKCSRSSKSKRYSKASKELWILVSSLAPSRGIANRVVKIYRQRMQIEENFRDTKSTKYGFGLNESLSRTPDRMNVLLLIAAIATFASWLAAIHIRQANRASNYQSQSAKNKGILSSVFLGREAIKKGFQILQKQFVSLQKNLFDIASAQNEAAY